MISDQWPSIDPGRFRHQVYLLERVSKTDEAGVSTAYSLPDVPLAAWVDIEYIRGDEMIKSGQDISQTFLKVTGWYRKEFSSGERIQTQAGQQYIIQYGENVREMNMYMVLTCLAIGPNS